MGSYINNRGWILGHDDGGFDRAIMLHDDQFGGLAVGAGKAYKSELAFPKRGVWTHIVATFSKHNEVATIYKNGGLLAGGQQQTVRIADDSGSVHKDIGLNGLRQWRNHEINGSFAQIQMSNEVIDADHVMDLYTEFDNVTNQ